ncbi:MAG TPA: diguanylate cyclase [Candidatus Tectomicrobia bacterium]|jgi:two-component system cell cycle response regulator
MEAMPLTILAIDDDPGDLELLRRCLEDVPDFAITLVACGDAAAGHTQLANHAIDVIMLDYLLGADTAQDVLREIRECGDRRPVIVLTGKGDERIAAAMMRAGADDYLVKDDLHPNTVYRSLRFVLMRFEEERKRVQLEEELQRLARFDELTGLCNRRYLLDRLTQEILRARRYGSPLSILMLDLDHFKHINDTYGHLVGDTVLATVASLLRDTVRATDIPGRYGGEEFCVVLTETKISGALLMAERLRRRIAAEDIFTMGNEKVSVTCSIGLAQFRDNVKDPTAFLSLADRALYQAKAAGRNCIIAAPTET